MCIHFLHGGVGGERGLFAEARGDVVDHGGGVVAAENVVAAVFQLDEETMVAAAIISEICADIKIAEIAPVTETSSTAAKPYPSNGWYAGFNRLNIAVGKLPGFRQKPVKLYP